MDFANSRGKKPMTSVASSRQIGWASRSASFGIPVHELIQHEWRQVGRWGRIQIDKKDLLGRGGFGMVYNGIFNGKSVAVKRIYKEDKYTPEEIRILEDCRQSNIVSFLFHDEDDDFFFAVMEKCDCDLFRFIEECDQAIADTLYRDTGMMHHITSGLCYLHAKGIIHRDIKLSNILVNVTGYGLEVKLTDFGISKILRKSRTSTSTRILGTVGYQASEVLRGQKIRQKSDVFSLGIVFFKILSGVHEHPFGKDPLKVDANIEEREPPDFGPVSHFPHARAFRALIESMIDHDIVRRYSSSEVEEVIEELLQRI